MLKEIIDKFYLEKQKQRKAQTDFYISEAGKCPRQIFFKLKNAPAKDLEANMLRLFDHGEHMHQLIMKSLISTRDIHVVASEVDIAPQELCHGRADAIISDGKELYVLDIKSMNSMVFKNLVEPKPENIDQIQLYLHYFNIKKGILLYVDKDRLDLKEFIVGYDKNRTDALLANFASLKKQVDSNIVPCRAGDYPAGWQCRFCQYKNVCSSGDCGQMDWGSFKKRIELENQFS